MWLYIGLTRHRCSCVLVQLCIRAVLYKYSHVLVCTDRILFIGLHLTFLSCRYHCCHYHCCRCHCCHYHSCHYHCCHYHSCRYHCCRYHCCRYHCCRYHCCRYHCCRYHCCRCHCCRYHCCHYHSCHYHCCRYHCQIFLLGDRRLPLAYTQQGLCHIYEIRTFSHSNHL